MSGCVGDLSPTQEEALRKLRAAVADLPKPEDDDYFYLRWLRARKFNLKKSEEMLRKHLQTREELGIDTTLMDWTPPEVLQKFFPGGFFGEDREGHPVWYDNLGNLDFRGLHKAARREDIVKLKAQHFERTVQLCKEYSEKKGKHIETVTAVLDCENLSLQKHSYWPGIEMLREMLRFASDQYPERSKRLIVVKAPAMFPVGYKFIKHFLDEETRHKIIVAGDNWKEVLQKYVAPDQLPEAYGGTRCEPDPQCTDHINPGYEIPPEYYLTNLTETDKGDMERTTVRRGSSYLLEFQVEEPQSVLSWEFLTTYRDIGFGLHFQQEQGDEKSKKKSRQEVIPVKRKNSHVIPEAGYHTCEITGTYVLKFDNSHSWTHSKELLYTVRVLPPHSEPVLTGFQPSGSSAAASSFASSSSSLSQCEEECLHGLPIADVPGDSESLDQPNLQTSSADSGSKSQTTVLQ